ncbi:hypothetical protein ACFQ0F_05830 [Paraperlucidibaca wandonensis]|uniref:Uncharacterized protein n=1 Tax=Paraperlucidibaca wandonensis TaxID=1268273 RepID=A0ABW3HFD0_9GAMM
MKNEMPLPQYYDLVRTIAQIGAVMGCLAGLAAILGGLASFQYGFMPGISALFGGAVTIIFSLAGLGVTYSFLSVVKAQIETRNAIVNYTLQKQDS